MVNGQWSMVSCQWWAAMERGKKKIVGAEAMAERMMNFYPFDKRLWPEKYDWNEELKARLK